MPELPITESPDQRLALPIEQGTLLWCMRVWVVGTRHSIEAETRIECMLAQLGAGPAAPYLDGLMFAIRHGAARPIGVRCVCCPDVSEDERALLDVFALAQEARPFEALLLLRGMLTAEGARAALRSAEGAGAALARAGWRLPAPELEVRQFAFETSRSRGGRPMGETLH